MIDADLHKLPADFVRHFDAHIYYNTTQRSQAEVLRNNAIKNFAGKAVFVGDLVDTLVGPHLFPMFELNFSQKLFGDVVLWLMRERGSLSVLVHPVTEVELQDHFQSAIWLGEALSLDASKLDVTPLL